MSGVPLDYTLVLSEERPGSPVHDYIVTDGGVLFATGDRGGTWRCVGLVDPEEFLLDLGFSELPAPGPGLEPAPFGGVLSA